MKTIQTEVPEQLYKKALYLYKGSQQKSNTERFEKQLQYRKYGGLII
jgi:hypothetical protein